MFIRSLITTMLTFGLLLPAGAYADDWIRNMIETAKAGSGTVIIENSSSVSTGGQTASGGQAVTTGDVSASSHTETRINTNGSGGSVEVKVETSQNGVTETREYSQKVEKDQAVHVEAEALATPDKTETEVRIDGQIVATETPSLKSSEAEIPVESKIETFFTASVPNFLKKIIGFIWPL